MRVIDQSKLKLGEPQSKLRFSSTAGDYIDPILVEAIRILDLICKLDPAQVGYIAILLF